MIYLIAELWMLLIVAGVVGLTCGWLMRGGSAASRAKEMEKRLREAEVEAAEQRREATELAAKLQSRGHGASASQVARLEQQLRDAQADANREAEAARDLRARLEELEVAAAPPSPNDDVEALRDEITRLNARVGELEPAAAEAARLREQLAAAEGAAPAPALDDASAARLEELETLVRSLETGDAEAYAKGDGDKRNYWMAARSRWLERDGEAAEPVDGGDAAALRAQVAELEAELKNARESASYEGGEADELRARIAELEADLAEARAGAAAPAAEGEPVGSMQARIAELEAALAAAPAAAATERRAGASGPAPDDVNAEIARLQWRNRYLDSRVRLLEKRKTAEPVPGDAPSAEAGDAPAPLGAPEENSLEWRNRYLASRVQHLENRLAEGAGEANGAAERTEDELRKARVEAAEAAKLRARVAELERTLEQTRAHAAGDPPPPEGEHALEWRNRYLSSRVKYLEERLTKLGAAGAAEEAAPSGEHGGEGRTS